MPDQDSGSEYSTSWDERMSKWQFCCVWTTVSGTIPWISVAPSSTGTTEAQVIFAFYLLCNKRCQMKDSADCTLSLVSCCFLHNSQYYSFTRKSKGGLCTSKALSVPGISSDIDSRGHPVWMSLFIFFTACPLLIGIQAEGHQHVTTVTMQ